MKSRDELIGKVFEAARDFGINAVLFRNALGRRLGLNITESTCLSLLAVKGISTPKELARYTGLTSGSTTTMLDRLEAKNFITRKPNPNDRRGILIEINEEYGQIAIPLVAGVQKAHKELIDSYTDEELEVIGDFLKRFTGNVVTHTKKVEEGR